MLALFPGLPISSDQKLNGEKAMKQGYTVMNYVFKDSRTACYFQDSLYSCGQPLDRIFYMMCPFRQWRLQTQASLGIARVKF